MFFGPLRFEVFRICFKFLAVNFIIPKTGIPSGTRTGIFTDPWMVEFLHVNECTYTSWMVDEHLQVAELNYPPQNCPISIHIPCQPAATWADVFSLCRLVGYVFSFPGGWPSTGGEPQFNLMFFNFHIFHPVMLHQIVLNIFRPFPTNSSKKKS